jgi:sec-independent protein translocase protein TatA
MTTLFAGFFGGWEIVLILAVVLILFGAKKLPELAKGLGQGIKEFKKATTDVQNEIHNAMDDTRYSQPRIEPPPPSHPPESTPSSVPSAHASEPERKV